MKYLLKNNNNTINNFNLFDCPITLLNHFEKGENKGNIYVIGALSPLNCANGFFNYPNVIFIQSVVDVQS